MKMAFLSYFGEGKGGAKSDGAPRSPCQS